MWGILTLPFTKKSACGAECEGSTWKWQVSAIHSRDLQPIEAPAAVAGQTLAVLLWAPQSTGPHLMRIAWQASAGALGGRFPSCRGTRMSRVKGVLKSTGQDASGEPDANLAQPLIGGGGACAAHSAEPRQGSTRRCLPAWKPRSARPRAPQPQGSPPPLRCGRPSSSSPLLGLCPRRWRRVAANPGPASRAINTCGVGGGLREAGPAIARVAPPLPRGIECPSRPPSPPPSSPTRTSPQILRPSGGQAGSLEPRGRLRHEVAASPAAMRSTLADGGALYAWPWRAAGGRLAAAPGKRPRPPRGSPAHAGRLPGCRPSRSPEWPRTGVPLRCSPLGGSPGRGAPAAAGRGRCRRARLPRALSPGGGAGLARGFPGAGQREGRGASVLHPDRAPGRRRSARLGQWGRGRSRGQRGLDCQAPAPPTRVTSQGIDSWAPEHEVPASDCEGLPRGSGQQEREGDSHRRRWSGRAAPMGSPAMGRGSSLRKRRP